MTTKKQPNPLEPRAQGSDEIPTVRAPQSHTKPLSFTRYLAPPEDYFCNRLWAEYKRHAREQSRGSKI
jgi:hypothetical protein